MAEIWSLRTRSRSDAPLTGVGTSTPIEGRQVEMAKQCIQPKGAPAPLGPYSPAVRIGDTVYCGGQIAMDPATGQLISDEIAAQTEQVIKNLGTVLQAAGCGLGQVVRTTIFLTDLGQFAIVNEVYGKYFSASPPARATVQVAALPKNARIEMDAIAHIGA